MGSRVETSRFQAVGQTGFFNLYSPRLVLHEHPRAGQPRDVAATSVDPFEKVNFETSFFTFRLQGLKTRRFQAMGQLN